MCDVMPIGRKTQRTLASALALVWAILGANRSSASPPAIDTSSLLGETMEQVGHQFTTAGYSWTPLHDNRYIVRVGKKKNEPEFTCIFAPRVDAAWKIAGAPVCHEIRVTEKPGSHALPFRSVVPPDNRWDRTYVMYQSPNASENLGPKFSVVLEKAKKDGNRVQQIYPILKPSAQMSVTDRADEKCLSVEQGWQKSTTDGSYIVELIGPRWFYNNNEDTETTRDVEDPVFFFLNRHGAAVDWAPSTISSQALFNPELQSREKIAASLILAVQREDWDWAVVLFFPSARATGLANCRAYAKDLEDVSLSAERSHLAGGNGSDYSIEIVTKNDKPFRISFDPTGKQITGFGPILANKAPGKEH